MAWKAWSSLKMKTMFGRFSAGAVAPARLAQGVRANAQARSGSLPADARIRLIGPSPESDAAPGSTRFASGPSPPRPHRVSQPGREGEQELVGPAVPADRN